MIVEIVIGWWIVPSVLTVIASVIAYFWTDAEPPGGPYSLPMRWALAVPVWLIVVQGSWLIWALLT